jgi:hypothetical protein
MTRQHSPDALEAIQVVVDRVTSYQDGAPEGTVRQELSRGLADAGLHLHEADVDKLSAAIEAEHGAVSVSDVL